jgi:uncharacterized protein (DUF3820 family)
MPFGKYRGQGFASIPTDYLVWVLVEADAPGPGLRALIRAELLRRGVEVDEDGAEDARERQSGSRQAPPPPPPRGMSGPDALEVLTRWYRSACKRHHPDRGGSETAMRVVNEAYAELRKLLGGS